MENRAGRCFQSMWTAEDPKGGTYVKWLQFSSMDAHDRHRRHINAIYDQLATLDHNHNVEHDLSAHNVHGDRYVERGDLIQLMVNCHVREWGVGRVPGQVREGVHELQLNLRRTLTDFGPDVGVVEGTPYNGRGPSTMDPPVCPNARQDST